MKIYRPGFEGAGMERLSGTAVALGRFDAMHKGHMKIIGRVVEHARKNGLKSVVFMFENNPREVIFRSAPPDVNTQRQREEILEDLGVDIVVAVRFDRRIMEMSCREFVGVYLSEMLGAEYAAAGFNYRFGKGGAGDIHTLCSLCEEYGITAQAVDEVSDGGETISSTRIRSLIADGDMETAKRLLGRYFKISGRIVGGNHIGGKILGFPTANIELPKVGIIPKFGVYISIAGIFGQRFAAITNVGGKPTVNAVQQCIETHIDGDFGNLYGQNIEIEFCRYIRGISKFDSMDALAERLAEDKRLSREFFEKYGKAER